jgi:N-acetyltransferase
MLTLENTVVRLEALNHTHISALLAIAQATPEVYRLTTAPNTLVGMTAYVESAALAREQRLALPFATINAVTGEVVGSTRFGNLEYWTWEENHPFKRTNGTPDAAEIGWTWLAPIAQRTGINSNAKLLMLTYAFETWGVRRVTLKTNALNHQSRNAILRIGASFEGILRSHMPGINGAAMRDTAMYSILESEWAGVKVQLQGLTTRV